MNINQKDGITLLVILAQDFRSQRTTKGKLNIIMRNPMNITQLRKALAKTSTNNNESFVRRRQNVCNRGLKRCCSRPRDKYCTGSLRCINELKEQPLVLKHYLRKLRRPEIRHLFGPDSKDLGIGHNRTNGKIKHQSSHQSINKRLDCTNQYLLRIILMGYIAFSTG